ncbi:MAG: Ti-type conjugative transfer relaxase TraA, partial [Sphingomonas sp.]|nr:Ti-type conjugative transfer relaxase TraA [Sphingomonas sp.]
GTRSRQPRSGSPDATRIVLTHTNDEVRALNIAARERLRAGGELGEDVAVSTERGGREFATGDRVMFLKNERGLGVKNGTLGTIESVTRSRMAVMLDDGRSVAFDTKDYANVDHGYAATVHKAQGVTVDRVHVLATPGLDRHAAYVALSRHRDSVDLHYGRDDFADQGRLVRAMSRERGKDMASDYTRRPKQDRQSTTTPARNRFAGLKLRVDSEPSLQPKESAVEVRSRVIARHARAVQSIFEMQDRGLATTQEQACELQVSASDLNGLREHAARDAEVAYARDPSLAPEAARGDTERARCAIIHEREVRLDPNKRADRFVERWNRFSQAAKRAYVAGDNNRRRAMHDEMRGMAKALERDPQVESILANRKRELGVTIDSGRTLGAELAFNHGFDLVRGRGLGIGM